MKVCKVCRIGRVSQDSVPYLHMLNGQIMVIPNVPAMVCDTCQHTEHDPAFMDQVDTLIYKDQQQEQQDEEYTNQFFFRQFRIVGAA